MSLKIKITWDDNNVISEGARIYKSNVAFTSTTLPPIYDEVGYGVEIYEDFDVIEDQTYFYMLSCFLGEQEKFTQCFEVKAKSLPTGFWALAVACWGTATLPQFNKDLTSEPTWPVNFKKTQDIISYVRAYNAIGNIIAGPVATKTVNAEILLGKRLELVVSAGIYNSNYGRMFLEFLDASDNVLAALKVDKAFNNFGSTLQIGHTLATVANVPSIGTYPAANGYLDILPTGIKYTPSNPAATTKFNEYTFTKNMSSLKKIRISELGAYQPHSTEAAGSPKGSSAYVYLKLLP